jgi:hypothetical protein
MLEEMLNLKIAMRQNKSKHIVKQKFVSYLEKYDNADKTVADKIRHREIFYTYVQFMQKSGDSER